MVAMNNPPPDEGTLRMAAFMAESQRVNDMDDVELADAIIDELMGVLQGRDEILVIELLSRFEEMAGIERDDEGEVTNVGGDGP